MNILSILNEISANPSKNDKIAILQRESNNDLLKQVFKAAYDPTINYYIKKIPTYSDHSHDMPIELSFKQIKKLSSREFTGGAAIEFLASILNSLSPDNTEVIVRIIQRDLKCGCSESSANKVWKNLIPEFPYMRCSLPKHVKLESWDWKNGIYSQLKADSLYCNMDVIGGEVILTSRAGKEFPIEKFQDIVSEASDIGIDCRIHGELQVAFDGEILPREISNGILNKVTQGGEFEDGYYPVYSVWDIIKIESAVPGGKDNTPYSNRFNALGTLFQDTAHIKLIETKIVYSLDEAYEHYFGMLEKGLEGTVIKTASGLWKDSTSKDQIKLKAECLVELRIKGFTQGNGKNADTFGSIECESEDGLLEVNVGTGLKDDDRNRLNKIKDSLIDGIVTVKFNGIMKSKKANKKHSLFLPIYIEIRDDKDVADTYQQILDQFDSIIKGK